MTRIRLLFLTFALAMAMVFAGCKGGEKKPVKAKTSQPTQRRITISVNNGPKDTEPLDVERWKLLVELFEKTHPDIHVKVEVWGFTPAVFAARAAGNQLTDVITTWATEDEVMLKNKLVSDMTEELTSWEDFKDIRPILLKSFKRNGHYYAFPTSAYSMGLFYNKALFRKAGIVGEKGEAKPPATWDEFVSTAQKLTDRKSGVCGFAILGGHRARTGWHFLNWGWQGGGEFEKKVNGRWRAVFDSPGVVRALQFIKDLRWKYDCLQANVLTDMQDNIRDFAAGRVGMMIEAANDNAVVTLREKYGFNLADLGIAALPEGPGGRFVQMGADYFVFRPGLTGAKKKAAFAWCTFFVSNELKEAEWKLRIKQGLPVGSPYIPIFSGERQRQWEALIEKYRNIPRFAEYQQNVVKYLKTEPPYYCQQLYNDVLGPAVQEVLTKKDADPAAILKKSAQMFQKRFLDKIGEK